MNNFIINKEEKSRILSMHKKLIKEQQEKTTITEDPNFTILKNARKVGCLSNGEIFRDKTKNTYFYRKPSSKEPTKEVDFFADMTYKFVDGSKSGKWKCDGLTTLANTEAQQNAQKAKETQLSTDAQTKKQQYISKFTGTPYNYLFNVEDIDKQKFLELDPVNDLRIPAGIFAVTDKFYSDPSLNKTIKGSSDSALDDVLENQSIDRKACRKNVEDYFKSFRRRNSIVIDGPTFNKAKRIVQSCKDEHYGKWGILGGGNKLDEILDTMSGGSGGPLSYGEDAKWRLK